MRGSVAFVLGAGLLLVGCADDGTSPEGPPERFFGTWNVVEVCGGIGGGCLEPDGRIVFERPDRASWIWGSSTVLSGRFRVREDVAPYGRAEIDLRTEANDEYHPWMHVFVDEPDSLVLGDLGISDGYFYTLVRE